MKKDLLTLEYIVNSTDITIPVETKIMAMVLDMDRVFGGKNRGRLAFRQAFESAFNGKFRAGKWIQYDGPLQKLKDIHEIH